jgi:hypothetical protein
MTKSKLNKENAKGKGISAKSLANLRPVKKGEPSRNPLGARLHNPAMKAIKAAGNETFQQVFDVVLNGTMQDLKALIENPESTNLMVLTASAFVKAIEEKNFSMVERIADRVLGKPKETLNVTSTASVNANVNTIDKETLRLALAKLQSDV